MAANYYCLLLDIDGTLLDFKQAEQNALSGVLQQAALPCDDAAIEVFSRISEEHWRAYERGEIKKEKMLVQRFSAFLAEIGAEGNAAQLNKAYVDRLANEAHLIPGAPELLGELAEFATLAAVSNGLTKVQMSRIEKSGLLPYFDKVYISEKMGTEKPAARFFDMVIKDLGIRNRKKVLVVGDSLTADIQGAANAKLDSCWCNFTRMENPTKLNPTYTIHSYEQLKLVAIGEEELTRAELREKRHLV